MKMDVQDMILRQLQGSLNASELSLLREWYDASADNRKEYRDYCVILKTQQIVSDARMFCDVDRAWNRVEKRMHPLRRGQFPMWIARYAAVAVISFAIAFFFLKQGPIRVTSHAVSVEIPMGSKTKIVLPDGTIAWLNSGTRLTYNSDFGQKERRVYMNGEGYFSVAKNKKVPFIIQSAHSSIRVLGTKFNMKAYTGDVQARITLLEGSLSVTAARSNKTVVIKPNQQAVITNGRSAIEVHPVVAHDYVLWTEAKKEPVHSAQHAGEKYQADIQPTTVAMRTTLIFDEEPLSQIACDLSRAFNVDIEVPDQQIASRVYYGDFRNNESLRDILNVITSPGDIHYTIQGNKIVIEK